MCNVVDDNWGEMYRLMCVLCTCDLDDATCLKFCSIQLHVIIV
jgi:hypothetical protein